MSARADAGRLVLLGGLALPAGFAVAELTGVRALGGAVLVLLALAGAVLAGRVGVAPARRAGLLVLGVVLFALAHPLAGVVGSIPAVACAGGVLAVAALAAVRGASTAVRRPT